jgi:hypothetical protein
MAPKQPLEYFRVHQRNRYQWGPASMYLCEGACNGLAQEWANVHGTDQYVPLCIPCHRVYDHPRCPQGHDTAKFGRVVGGGCRVCHRLHEGRRRGTAANLCKGCGLRRCQCSRG